MPASLERSRCIGHLAAGFDLGSGSGVGSPPEG